jgi:hypothetical protein
MSNTKDSSADLGSEKEATMKDALVKYVIV